MLLPDCLLIHKSRNMLNIRIISKVIYTFLLSGIVCLGCMGCARHVPRIDSGLIKVDTLLWDLNALCKPPKMKVLEKGKVVSLLYQGADYHGNPTSVFAYYSNPALYVGEELTDKKYPGVVLVHGGGGTAFKEWVEKWVNDGYAALAMDLSGKGKERTRLEDGGPDQGTENKFGAIETGSLKDVWTYQAVSNVILAHSLLLSFPEVDANKTCLTGISWGGYLTCIVGSLDNRFKAAVPVYGCAFYDEADTFKKNLMALTPSAKEKWMKFFDPSVYLPFACEPFLFINGNKDKHYNVIPYHKTYSLVSPDIRTICIKPNMRHGHKEGWEPPEIKCFFESIVNGGDSLPKINNVFLKNTMIDLCYHSKWPIDSAMFYYSNDTVSLNIDREWRKKDVVINPEKDLVQCTISKEDFSFGFFTLTDERGVSVSSEFIIKNEQ